MFMTEAFQIHFFVSVWFQVESLPSSTVANYLTPYMSPFAQLHRLFLDFKHLIVLNCSSNYNYMVF